MTKQNINKLIFLEDFGICERCGQEFTGDKSGRFAIRTQISEQFREHECKRRVGSQKHSREGREATDGK